MIKFRFIIRRFLAATVVFASVAAYAQVVPEITASDVQKHISYLAADELGGRYPGTDGSRKAAEYIREQFRASGLALAGNEGFQDFEVVVSVSAGDRNQFMTGGNLYTPGVDYAPFPFSKNASLNAQVVFAGYGFDISMDSLIWNDYNGIDVSGKWVMILRGDPEIEKQESRFANFGDDRGKVLIARDKGAAGVLFVSGKKFDSSDDLVEMYFDKTQSTAGLPVVHIKRTLADILLARTGQTVESLETGIIQSMQPASIVLQATVDATTEIIQHKVMARNVIGIIEGTDPVLKDSYIVIGAHYDHLGMGGTGSGSRFMDSLAVHNGADDNASGVAGVLELADYFSKHRKELKRSLIFVAFDGEELGLLGSRHFTAHAPVDVKQMMAMINFDMIGRLKADEAAIMIGGTGTSAESEEILNSLQTDAIKLNYSPEGFGPSDHAAFYAENITVFFISTGAHEDYHTPDDDAQKINFAGEADLLQICSKLVLILAQRNEPLTFREAGPKQQEGRGGYRFKVTLGIMPDFTSTTEGGLGVGGVKKDGPAYKGGVLKGDVITAIDGKPVGDIYDYMNRLKTFKPGQVISVDILRSGEHKVLIIQL